MRKLLLLLIVISVFASCSGNHDYSPKPRGYYRIVFPEKAYQSYSTAAPFTFQYPKYAVIEPDRNPNAKLYWLNMRFPQFNGTLHLSYEHILSKKEFNQLAEDAYKLS